MTRSRATRQSRPAKKRPRRGSMARALAELTAINAALLARLSPPAPPPPAPVQDTSRQGHCGSCGFRVGPKWRGCVRCAVVTLRPPYPEWITPEVIDEAKRLNNDRPWPKPTRRYTHIGGLRRMLGQLPPEEDE